MPCPLYDETASAATRNERQEPLNETGSTASLHLAQY
jgi:hypothetical protein